MARSSIAARLAPKAAPRATTPPAPPLPSIHDQLREVREAFAAQAAELAEIVVLFDLSRDDAAELHHHWRLPACRRSDDLKEHVRLVLAERRRLAASLAPAVPGEAIASAESFAAAIAALPVGRDIRARLTDLLDTHIAALRREAR